MPFGALWRVQGRGGRRGRWAVRRLRGGPPEAREGPPACVAPDSVLLPEPCGVGVAVASRRTSVQGPRDSRAGVSQGKPRATKPVWRREALWRAVSCPPGFASPPNVFTRFKFHSWNPRGVLPPRLAGNSEYSQDGVNLGQRKPGLPPHGTCYCWKGWVRPVLRVLIDSACSGGLWLSEGSTSLWAKQC